MGMKTHWRGEFAALQLRFEGTTVKVAARFRGDAAVLDRLANCFMYLFDFRSWSDTRWCAVGRICRRICSGLLVGLDSLVKFVLASPSESNYYLAGYQNLTLGIARMVVICACTGGVSEAPLAKLLEDDRLPRMLPTIDSCVQVERDRALSIAMPILEMLSRLCDASASELLDQMSHAVAVQISYAEHRIREARQLPWSLIGLNIEERLLDLKSGVRPSEPTSEKIWLLLQLGAPIDALVAGVRLLGEMPWTSRTVEQGHVLSSSLMQWHKLYTSDTLTARTTVCAMKALVAPRVASKQRKLQRSCTKLAKLRRKQPQKCGPRQAFMGHVLKQARKTCSAAQYDRRARPYLVRSHSRAWAAKSRAEQAPFCLMAERLRDRSAAQTSSDIRQHVQTVQSLSAEVQADRARGQSLRMSDCGMSDALKVEFTSLYNSDVWSVDLVRRLRLASASPVEEPDAVTLATLRSMDVTDKSGPEVFKPHWLGWMTEHRTFFRRCLLKLKRAGGDEFLQIHICTAESSARRSHGGVAGGCC
jgi:hypothetical protein